MPSMRTHLGRENRTKTQELPSLSLALLGQGKEEEMKPLSRTPAEHIAVGLQILYPLDGGDFGPVTKGQRELINAAASTILSQHEEIQRLKGVCLDAYERAAQVCEALDEHSITLPQAIRALKTGEPK